MKKIEDPSVLRPWVYRLLDIIGVTAAQADSMTEQQIDEAIEEARGQADRLRDLDAAIKRARQDLAGVSEAEAARQKALSLGMTEAEIEQLKARQA